MVYHNCSFLQDSKALIGQMRRILELARPERFLIGGAIGLLCGSTAVSLAVPKVMGGLIDAVMQNTGSVAVVRAQFYR